MGKRLKQQRRGKGTPRYRAPKKRFVSDARYRTYDDQEKASLLKAEIKEFVDDPGRNAILMKLQYDNGEKGYLIAPEGAAVGDEIEIGAQARITLGGVLPLYRVPDGYYVYNIEKTPGDGGKLVRSSGGFAIVVSKEGSKVYLKLPSKRIITLSSDCRAQIGIVAGGGRTEKPLMKAGNAYYKHKARNRLWPVVRGVHMSAYNHPHGGKQHHVGKPTTVSKHTPPGGKVGHVGARTTGRKKSKKVQKEVK